VSYGSYGCISSKCVDSPSPECGYSSASATDMGTKRLASACQCKGPVPPLYCLNQVSSCRNRIAHQARARKLLSHTPSSNLIRSAGAEENMSTDADDSQVCPALIVDLSHEQRLDSQQTGGRPTRCYREGTENVHGWMEWLNPTVNVLRVARFVILG
jgi:hypothetical protein